MNDLFISKEEYAKLSTLDDSALIDELSRSTKVLGVLYKKHLAYCLKFMQKQCNGQDYDDTIKDIYQDAVIVLYEKVKGGNFTLTSSIQTYLNSICRYQLLNRFKEEGKITNFQPATDFDNEDEPHKYRQDINDWLPKTENDINGDRVQAIMKGLEIIKSYKGICYELLSMVYYHNKTMKQLVEYFPELSHEDSAKSKNYKCKEKLKSLTFEIMKKKR